MSSRDVRNQLQNFLDYLQVAEIALIANPVSENGRRVTWRAPGAVDGELFRSAEPTVAEYVGWVEAGAYSAILFDGALLQITFDFDGAGLVGHRLAYVPCPFDIDAELVATLPIVDVVQLYAEQSVRDVRIRASLRFDYDPAAQQKGHAAAHVSLNATHCRVPCVSALGLGHFVSFVFQQFYPELWSAHEYVRALPRGRASIRTILPEEEEHVHVAWREV